MPTHMEVDCKRSHEKDGLASVIMNVMRHLVCCGKYNIEFADGLGS